MIAVGWVVQRACFINDAQRRFVRGDGDLFDVFNPVLDLRMQLDGRLDRQFARGIRLGRRF